MPESCLITSNVLPIGLQWLVIFMMLRVMTIVCCHFQSEDKDAQIIFWKNLNHVMARHGIPLPQFQGFMADSAQANWNAVRIVYSGGDPKVAMLGRE